LKELPTYIPEKIMVLTNALNHIYEWILSVLIFEWKLNLVF
jgi:hypothetical protein